MFDIWGGKEGDTFEDGWKNKLIWGDNLLVMGSLMEKFAGKVDLISLQALYEYLAFILKLYGAQPLVGLAHLHGKNGKATVHIGAVNAPVTIDEINAAVAECVQVRQTELHVLGWEWEMGLYDLMVAEAKKQGVKLLLLQIPREVMEQQAVDKGDIQFFELAYLEVEIGRPGKLTATITLKDFIISNTELLPEEVRSKIKTVSYTHLTLPTNREV